MSMMLLDHGFYLLTLAGAGLGGWSICWARAADRPGRVRWGHCLFVITCLGLGLCLVAAACWQANGMAALGLCLGLLLVAMCWEAPARVGSAVLDESGIR